MQMQDETQCYNRHTPASEFLVDSYYYYYYYPRELFEKVSISQKDDRKDSGRQLRPLPNTSCCCWGGGGGGG